jgi:nitroreductase
MRLSDAIASRRSVRSFTAEPVTADQVRQLLAAAVLAPTAMHAEPWQFVVVQDRERLRRYSQAAKHLLIDGPYGALHDPLMASRHPEFFKALHQADFDVFYGAGTLIAICGATVNPFVAADCWLAAENLMLTARAMELGTCCVGSAVPALNTTAVKDELGIPFDVSVVAAIVVGVPAEWPAASTRKPPAILTWVTDNQQPTTHNQQRQRTADN